MATLNLSNLIRKPVAAPAATPVVSSPEETSEVEVVAEEAAPAPAPKPVTKPTLAKPVAKPVAPTPKAVAPVAKPVTKPAPAAAVVKKAAPVTTVAVVEDEDTAVGSPIAAGPLGSIDGEVTARDMAIPYLTLVQKQGKLFDSMPDSLGNFVYDKQLDLGDEVEVVFLRATKYYLQDIEYGSQEIPRRWTSSAAYRAEGFNDSQVKEAADLDLLVAVPQEGNEAIGELTTIESGGKWYLPARYTVRSTAYGKTFSILVRDRSGWLKGSLLNGSYKLGSERRTNPETSWFVPNLSPGEKTTLDLRDTVLAALSLG